tara:strand:+ start:97 stop:345 length:249 start_codon:yes stop_codon:yes gene_type:complete
MKVFYFAWLKNKTGKSEEFINDKKIRDVKSLINYISKKYPDLKDIINKKDIIRIAVNLNYITKNKRLNKNDEIAIFPPVSGG